MDFVIYSIYLRKLEELQRFEQRLSTPPFMVMLIAAFALHIMVFLVISFMPKPNVLPIPIKELSIHIGGSEAIAKRVEQMRQGDAMIQALNALPTAPIDAQFAPSAGSPRATLTDTQRSKDATQSPAIRPKKNAQATPTKTSTTPAPAQEGSSLDAAATKEVMTRYEQTLSQWINRYKVYPEEAQRAGMQGRVMLRIRIDRSGYIQFVYIEESSGFGMLDQAVIQAARQANPLPVVPTDYPGGQLLEFIIPVRFALR